MRIRRISVSRMLGWLLLGFLALPLCAETWFVRPDGGTRYSSRVHNGQCDGKADAPYPGKGTDRHCAFSSAQYLYLDGTYGFSKWVIAGGDTVVIRGCAALPGEQNAAPPDCRIGYGNAMNKAGICFGVNDCGIPPPPSGTAANPTRILGGCAYGRYTCSPVMGYPYAKDNLTQLYGGFGLGAVLSLAGSRHVEIEGLEFTSHNGKCARLGYPADPARCNAGYPWSDYSNVGISFSNTTSNILLQDVYIHGFTGQGIYGPIGGPVALNRVSIDFNAFAGWNFDDGHSTPDAPGSTITASFVRMEGNGCMEEYPIVHKQFPALRCWDSESGGFGDSWSGQGTKLDSFVCDHCVMAYNTKDGFMGPHTQIHYLKITNSQSYGNMGQQWKWGVDDGATVLFEDNLTVGNCRRMAEALPGARPGFNRYLSLFCRAAGDIISFYGAPNSTALFADDSTVGYSATTFDISCASSNACSSSKFIFRNNIVLGFLDPKYGSGEVPGLFYLGDHSVKLTTDHDLFYNLRSKPCPYFGSTSLLCTSPEFENQPPSTLSSESQMDHFNFHPKPGSPEVGHGVAVEGITKDFFGVIRPNPPTIGAAEPQR
ncbi:MAG: hypothetical protein ACP5E5_09700 [Acidobacteriaceae bacterium]